MTDVYAHTLDQTLKQEWLATKERVNAAGERVALTTPLIDDDAAWLKHQFARAKQTLPDGECYRPVLQEQLARAEQRVGDAQCAGHERLAQINRPDVLDAQSIRTRRSTTPGTLAPRPAADRATIASLQARLGSAHEEVARLNLAAERYERLAGRQGGCPERHETTSLGNEPGQLNGCSSVAEAPAACRLADHPRRASR